ncbi:MAG: AraC family transcriptional regulator [Sporomusaceae bacterium]|nr:AraC family transcriptional regulator [Sporomusaceae bacterium]
MIEAPQQEIANERGYLNKDFQFFHLKDCRENKIESHFHDFYKVLFFLSGSVTYLIEGMNYRLQPGDILLLHRGTIHKPLISADNTYDRQIAWFSPAFLNRNSEQDCDLQTCFQQAHQNRSFLLLPSTAIRQKLSILLTEWETALTETGFGHKLRQRLLALELLIALNQAYQHPASVSRQASYYDKAIVNALVYIDSHLTAPLTVDHLAARVCLSKYHFMRKFKEQTGYSPHHYITQKRLICANQWIDAGEPLLSAALNSGFSDYSTFIRSFKKAYGLAPKKYYNRLIPSNREK